MEVQRLVRWVENAKCCHKDQKARHEDVEYCPSGILLSSNRIQDLHMK